MAVQVQKYNPQNCMKTFELLDLISRPIEQCHPKRQTISEDKKLQKKQTEKTSLLKLLQLLP